MSCSPRKLLNNNNNELYFQSEKQYKDVLQIIVVKDTVNCRLRELLSMYEAIVSCSFSYGEAIVLQTVATVYRAPGTVNSKATY